MLKYGSMKSLHGTSFSRSVLCHAGIITVDRNKNGEWPLSLDKKLKKMESRPSLLIPAPAKGFLWVCLKNLEIGKKTEINWSMHLPGSLTIMIP